LCLPLSTLGSHPIGLFITVFAISRLRGGLKETFKAREKVMRMQAKYMFIFGAFWVLWSFMNGMTYFVEDKVMRNGWNAAISFLLAGKGMFDLIAWFWVNNPDDPEHDKPTYSNLSPAVNAVLRRELLDMVTKGIREALVNSGTAPPELQAIANPTSVADPDTLGEGLISSTASYSTGLDNGGGGSALEGHGTLDDVGTAYTEHEDNHQSSRGSFGSRSSHGSEHDTNVVHLSRVRDLSSDGADLLTSRHAALGSEGISRGSQLGRTVLQGISRAPLISSLGASEKSKVEFHDYKRSSFARVRKAFGMNDDEYAKSFSGENTREQLSEGASNAFFFFTGDQKMLVKSMTVPESKLLRRIAKDYATYMEEHPSTLLPRFYGCHCIQLYGQRFHFMVMANVFPPDDKVRINTRYDIKGSWISRNAKPKKPENGQVRLKVWDVDERVLKDNDLHSKIVLDEADAIACVDQLQKDADFLCSWGIMDYSLLVGVCDREYHFSGGVHQPLQSPKAEGYGSTSSDNNPTKEGTGAMQLNAARCVGPAHYYIGVIDTLQEWDWRKKGERFLKMYLKGKDGKGISCIEPEKYKRRFQLRVQDIIIHPESAEFLDERPADL
jgi:hypothetical protein